MKKKQSKLYQWQQKAKEGGVCARCKRHTDYLTVDHIVPLHLIEMLDETGLMGYEDETNFQLLCHPCNRFKSSRIDRSDPKLKEVLLKLVNEL